jgi:hypothetical protein
VPAARWLGRAVALRGLGAEAELWAEAELGAALVALT